MNLSFLIRMHHTARHAFLYLLIALVGSFSLVSVSSASLRADLHEAIVLARSYQVDDVEGRSQQMEDDSSFERQIKKWKPVTISWLPVSLGSLYIYNQVNDVIFVASFDNAEVRWRDHLIMPLGNQAPPAIL